MTTRLFLIITFCEDLLWLDYSRCCIQTFLECLKQFKLGRIQDQQQLQGPEEENYGGKHENSTAKSLKRKTQEKTVTAALVKVKVRFIWLQSCKNALVVYECMR